MKIRIAATAATSVNVWAEALVQVDRKGFNRPILTLDGQGSTPEMKKAAKFLKTAGVAHVIVETPYTDPDPEDPYYGEAIILMYGPKAGIEKFRRAASLDSDAFTYRKKHSSFGGLNINEGDETSNIIKVIEGDKKNANSVVINTDEGPLTFSAKEGRKLKHNLTEAGYDYDSDKIV